MTNQDQSNQSSVLSTAVASFVATAGVESSHDASSASSSRPGPGEDHDEWTVETSIVDDDSLGVGDSVNFTKRLEESDARDFAAASGDTNPLHFDTGSQERFDGPIAHGLLVSGLISAALARFPGSVVYLSQDVSFHNPVYFGDRVTAECNIVENLGEGRFRLRTTVENGAETAIDGEAVVLVES